jgi:hypothetical protein
MPATNGSPAVTQNSPSRLGRFRAPAFGRARLQPGRERRKQTASAAGGVAKSLSSIHSERVDELIDSITMSNFLQSTTVLLGCPSLALLSCANATHTKVQGRRTPCPRPNNRPPTKTQANCKRYCGVLTSALIHLANTNSREAVTLDAMHIIPYRLGLKFCCFPRHVAYAITNGKYWSDDEESHQLHSAGEPRIVRIHKREGYANQRALGRQAENQMSTLIEGPDSTLLGLSRVASRGPKIFLVVYPFTAGFGK